MKRVCFRLSLSLLAAALGSLAEPLASSAQNFSSSRDFPAFVTPEPGSSGIGIASTNAGEVVAPFSRIAFGADFSPLGVGFMTATNVNRHLNLRADGSFFRYAANNISTQGLDITAKINLSSARASLDYYPFRAGFRLSPGLMYYNQNGGTLNLAVAPGASFTLNHQTYYSATGANAVQGAGTFVLGNGSPAFTLTTGWGNVIPHSGRHFSFPFEVGVAFIKAPTLNFNLTGYGCDVTGVYCVNVATDPQIQANLAAQVQQYRSDLNPLKTYPIVSFGVAYDFRVRKSQ